jgi:hypothetical protein
LGRKRFGEPSVQTFGLQDRRTIFGTTPHGGVTEKMAVISERPLAKTPGDFEQPEAFEAVVVVRDADPLGKLASCPSSGHLMLRSLSCWQPEIERVKTEVDIFRLDFL